MPSYFCQAVLFDLDGVLVDSTPCVTRVWTGWARQHGLDPEYVVHMAHGKRSIETVRQVAPQLNAELENAGIEQQEIDDTEGLRVLPGAKALLESLPPDRFTIVTSGTRRLATRRLEFAGLPVPPRMVTADDVTKGKPDPEPYLAGARMLGREPGKCMVFEDAPSGILAARSAGMVAIALTTTYPAAELTAANQIIATLESVRVNLQPSGELAIVIGSPA
jgi:mannitol-1-/sugar-/sorbitol-6-phosphatase